jgi:hypothetical protein
MISLSLSTHIKNENALSLSEQMRQMGMKQLYIILRNIVVAKGGDIVDARKTNLLEDFQWCMFEAPNDAVTTLHKAYAEFNYQLPSHRRRRKEAEEDSIAATSVELLNVRQRNFTKEARKTQKNKMARARDREIQQNKCLKLKTFCSV